MTTILEPIDRSVYREKLGVFGNRWEKWLVDHWYIPLVTPYLIIKLLRWINFARVDGRYVCYSRAIDYISGENRNFDLVYIATAIAMIIIILLFRNWQQKVPEFFDVFLPTRINHNKKNGDNEYLKFIDQYKSSLRSVNRYPFIALLVIAIESILFIYYFTDVLNLLWVGSCSYKNILIISMAVWLLFPAVWVYLAGAGAWAIIATSRAIRDFVKRFDMKVEPYHVDNAGGLKAIGEFCFSMTSPLIVGTVFCGLTAYLFITAYQGYNASPFADPVFLGFLIALAVAIPLNFVAFFSPMSNMHVEMARQKKIFEDDLSNEVNALEEKTRELIRQGKLEQAKKTKESVELLLTLRPNPYPDWPFARTTLIKFLTTQIPSLVAFFQSGIDFIASFLKLSGNSS
jgi:hypothetical protein